MNPLDYPICLTHPKRLTPFSAWHEHIPFAMFLVDLLKPTVIIELGTQYGDSYCAFCQAVRELNLRTRCYAIDTWQGDPHTGFYGLEVLADLRSHHDPLYGTFSRLIQSTFDDALAHFPERTVDLLHIDGYHTYEVVKHDFESWLPKMSPYGVILFHDINVREHAFGVWKLWDELKTQYRHFEFLHGHGLGVLALGRRQEKAFQELLGASEEDSLKIRTFFFELGHRLVLQVAQRAQQQVLAQRDQQLANLAAERDRVVEQMRGSLAALQEEVTNSRARVGALSAQAVEKQQALERAQAQVMDREQEIHALHHSESYRLGLLLTWPLRKASRLLQASRREPRELTTNLGGLGESIAGFADRRPSEVATTTLQPIEEAIRQPENELLPLQFRSFLKQMLCGKLKLFLSQTSAKLTFPCCEQPVVTIVIPTFNKAEYLFQCLESIIAYTDVPFQLIIVDDCSQDQTLHLLKKLENVEILKNDKNVDFIQSCNKVIDLASGKYLLFLNNDVIVTPQWLSGLLATMERYADCGAVGVKLVRPDGSLQEAGSIIWRDGSASAYGRNDNPLKPEYCYLREVDYCSAACLLVRTELFHKLGGFDERYLPAYYEDSDLCFEIRRLGCKVVFQPCVTIIHYEFGSRSFERAKALCETNQPKFVKKWTESLQEQWPSGEILRARDRRRGRRVLVMDDQVPAPYLGSGLPRAHQLLVFLAELGWLVTFAPLNDQTPHQPTTQELQQLGVEVFYGDGFSPEEVLRSRAGYYDVVLISRPHNGAKFLQLARQHCPRARIIYDAEALFCLREFRRAQVEDRFLAEADKEKMLSEELALMADADVVIAVSDHERDIMVREGVRSNVVVWGHTHNVHVPTTTFSKRRDLLFVGGFMQGHPPNTDAALHFTTKLFPTIREKLPDCRFIIVGSNPTKAIQQLSSDFVVVTGYVENLLEYYEKCRVFVVPLRFGAGINYKLTDAMSYGIPAVISSAAAFGLDLQNRREALIAINDQEFIERTIELYEDEQLWHTVQCAAQKYIRENCSPKAMREKLTVLLA
ncbi:MAG TPA: class I SAM-dependent methyltransferase [Candidatus Binatia bacterium]|nr:class I SAM-dependent methyltransferase [Candidatus Binatia bacterium]